MLEAQRHALDVRNRIMRPVNGRESSELEIISAPELRRIKIETQTQQDKLERTKRESRASELMEQYKLKLDMWVAQGLKEPDIDGVPYVSLGRILAFVCKRYGVRMIDLKSGRRGSKIVRPRHIAMYLGRDMTTLSLPRIGQRIGGRDHTTVLHGINKIGKLLLSDLELASEIDLLRKAIAGEAA